MTQSARRARVVTPGLDGLERPPLSFIAYDPANVLDGLAEAFLAGPWNAADLVERGGMVLRRRYRWLQGLAERVIAAFPDEPPQRRVRLSRFLWNDRILTQVRGRQALRFVSSHGRLPSWARSAGPTRCWPVTPIATPAELARFLELSPGELDWFADCQARGRANIPEPLRHYRYHWVAKASGSLRLIEAPKFAAEANSAPAARRDRAAHSAA